MNLGAEVCLAEADFGRTEITSLDASSADFAKPKMPGVLESAHTIDQFARNFGLNAAKLSSYAGVADWADQHS